MFLFLLQSNDPDLPYQDSDVESECSESDDDIESGDDDRFSFTGDSSDNEEEELEGPFPEEYNPEGVESDDDESSCSHWSKTKHFDMNRKIQADAASPELIWQTIIEY